MTTIHHSEPKLNLFRQRTWRPLPWSLRGIIWVLILFQAILPFAPQVLADSFSEIPSIPPATTQFAMPPAEPVVTVNRTVPNVAPPSTDLQFSAEPTDEEISSARAFEGPIISLGKTASPTENADLAAALLAYRNRQDPDDASAIENFLQGHPDSPRYISLLGNLASHYRSTGQFSKALAAWQQVWTSGKDITDVNGRQIVDQSVSELVSLLNTIGRTTEAGTLMQELQGRNFHGAAAVKMSDAKSALWQMLHQPNQAFKCGPYSLSRIQAVLNPSAPIRPEILTEESTTNGTSLYQNWLLAQKIGLKYQMARRQSGADIPLPVMVHWKLGHFSALTKMVNGRYLIEDSALLQGWISPKVLDEESDGYFLIPDGPLPAGWSAVTESEGETVFGRGWPYWSDGSGGGDGCGGGPSGGGAAEGGDTKSCPIGMPQYMFNMMRIGLDFGDVPLGYTPPRGPEVEFRIIYSERTIYESGPFTHSNLGNQWTYEWLAYISDNTTMTNANVTMVLNDGNSRTFNSNLTNNTYAVEEYSQGQLTRTSGSSYQCVYPDGSQTIYSQPDNTNGARRVFLTKKIDPAGNALTFTYDSTNRLVSVKDAIGQVTTLSYGLTNDIYKITQVTDPFGRNATLKYNASGQLTNITDEIGISSSFAYGATNEADFINSMTTPYGTTTFSNNNADYSTFSISDTNLTDTRWIQATDPLGGQERVEFMQGPPGVSDSDPANLVPAGLNTTNENIDLSGRMSFFWNKATMQAMQGQLDFSKARQYVWDRVSGNFRLLSRTLESIKQPMENARVWFNYPGQTECDEEGTINTPTIIARVLDDGTTQSQQYQYNAIGKPTQAIDPAGRTTLFTYSTNNIDLLTVAQKIGASSNLLARYSYNSQHLPTNVVDAAGQTTTFGYNTNGQLLALTNALSQIVLLSYSTNGYLTNIVAGTITSFLSTNSFTYDGYGRVRTVTDSLGYTITTSYDSLDRHTNITYMDGTYEQIVYDKLDTALMRDRDGHWTAQVHDQLRHLTDAYDFIGRHTQMSWCTCGALEGITDPAGNLTAWNRDLQNRVTAKIYPDLTQIRYNYETNSSRLLSVNDAKNQSTLYGYYIDNNLKSVSYSNAVVATPSVSFAYDTNYDRITSMVDGTGTNSYSYYPVSTGQFGAGMLSSVSNSFVSSFITYNYDALGRITNRAINNVAEQLTYDALGRVTTVTNALGGFTNIYLGGSALLTTNFAPLGKKTIFSYLSVTNDERLKEIWNQKTNSVTLSKFDYVYDAVGQITNWTQQADTTATNVQALTYDPVNQLLSDTVHSNTIAGAILKQYAYGYDAVGNRTTEQIGTGNSGPVAMSQSSYNNDNQMTSRTVSSGAMLFAGSVNKQPTNVLVAGVAATINRTTTNFMAYASVTTGTNKVQIIANDYNGNSAKTNYQVIVTNNGVSMTIAFDLNGNESSVVTSTATNIYQWDAANRLVSVTGPTNQSLFTYDGAGRILQIIENTNGFAMSTNKYVWCEAKLYEQRNNTGLTVTKRFFDQGEQISSTNYFYARDHLGSVREMVDSTGTIQARYDYDPYGRRAKISGALDADFAYAGYYYHSTSKLYLTLFRAYDADLGRWLNRDPIGEEGGLNLYDYVANNSISLTDPLGLDVNSPPPCAPYPSCLNNPPTPNQHCPNDAHPCRQCFIDFVLGKAKDYGKDKIEAPVWKILYRNTTRLGKQWIKKGVPYYGEYSMAKDAYDLAACLTKCDGQPTN